MIQTRSGGEVVFSRPPRIGCDLTDVNAVAESIATFGDRYLRRVYSATERAQTGEVPERLAARFAGKEAVLKVLRATAEIRYSEIEIVLDSAGAPVVRLAPRAQQQAADQRLGEIAVSLSHERGFALATAIALPDDRPQH
jgi:holo-[acyl-carrier protein] synthase